MNRARGHSSHSGKHCGIISMHFPRQALDRTSFTSLSLSLFFCRYLAHSIRRGAIRKHCQIGQKCHKNIFGWQLQEESASTTNCWGCLCWVNVDIDVDVDFGHETQTQLQRQSQTGTGNAVRELWPHKIRQSMSQNGQIAELLLLLPQLQCGTN